MSDAKRERKNQWQAHTKVEMVFLDWQREGKSIYATEEGIKLSSGDFHSGTTFPGVLFLNREQYEDLKEAWASGARPCFWLHPPEE